ncbi:hypothetical protein RE628_12810 [Paenibacillus sp. D2_2]|uniref:hypothetical protein n=1 Tax=Paenibacillus sp. D2_2 TaxID=3073092 RepID=UPI002815AA54|nr:hypothetical protein [Paenibacillus sp. D2_2]WMT43068.1 hypothetical protein RE628_12810 [Paenibacillus sp. D2_2]
MAKSRRWVAVCLAVLLSLSVALVGCGKQGESNKQAGQAGKEGTAQQQTNSTGSRAIMIQTGNSHQAELEP